MNYVVAYTKGPAATSIPIYFDPPDSAEVAKAKTLRAGMEVEGIPLRTTLRLLLAQVGMQFSVKNGILIINEPQGIGGMGGGGGMMGQMMRMRGMSGYGGMMGRMSGTGGMKTETNSEDTATKPKQTAKKGKKTGSKVGN